jgi:hypothetical protein
MAVLPCGNKVGTAFCLRQLMIPFAPRRLAKLSENASSMFSLPQGVRRSKEAACSVRVVDSRILTE